MPVQNAEIARIFEQVADLLEIQQANRFRVRAYRTAAQTVRGLPRALHELVARGEDLSRLPGIGEDLAGKIAEIVRTGKLRQLAEIGHQVPRGLAELLAVPGIGPQRVRRLHEELGIRSRAGLLRAARQHRVRTLPGFGARTEQAILDALAAQPAGAAKRTLWSEAEPVARQLVADLRRLPGVEAVEVAGSFRRRRETVGDLDLLVASRHGATVVAHFVGHEDVARVLARGTTKASVRLRSGLQVDLRVVERAAYGAALVYFTGSKAHTIALRRLAVQRRLKLNEYGAFRGARRVAGRTERDVYRSVGLHFVEPELRENRGEIELARKRALPRLVQLGDLRGDLHAHTDASDGADGLQAMAAAAKKLGHEYLAITDHTRAARIAHGLDVRAMRRHLARIERLDRQLRGIRILRSAEVDILADGSLDLPDDLLAELDLVVAAVHSDFRKSRSAQTERILRAMDHPRLHVLAHPSGRLLGEREGLAVDLERIVAGAAERGCCLELNCQPTRLDLPDVWLQAAKEAGVKIAISTDAHSTAQLALLAAGVGYARRGWLQAEDVLNTRSWADIARLLRRGS
ncbi:MAG: DNA polymerase/3'-5' exonuclease PolX [Planctomycetes bacterium]|nr:DNA polymerase/3'-5' exonuclease PolX [Planctomycetota bacterium]